MPDAVDLDSRLDELFAASPDAFVATREALVRDLKREGRPTDAAHVHALRRPTIAVWGINQMARSHARQLAALVAAGTDVQRHQAAGVDAGDDLRSAARTRRALLDELTDAAAGRAERPDAVRASIAATLDAASLDATLRDDLLGGHLTAELAPAVRFFGQADDSAPLPRRSRAPKPAPPAPARDDLAARRAESALAEARARVEEAEDEMRGVEGESRDAHDLLDITQRRVAELEAALADARAEMADARRRVTESQRAETKARTARRRADAALHVAERRARDAGTQSNEA